MTANATCPAATPPSPAAAAEADRVLQDRLGKIRHRFIVLSGKGGVGKSTIAVNLAWGLAEAGSSVGLLDVDIHGPSIPKLFGLSKARLNAGPNGISPIRLKPNLRVMSVGFIVESPQDAVIWRGPLKYKLIQQFLRDVDWGTLDYLIVDSPPGTGDEPLTVVQLIGQPASAIVVTTPQEVAVTDVRRSITFCRKLSLPVAGLIENMSGFVCPHCGGVTDLFGTGGGEALAREMNVPFLGRLPLDPAVVLSGEAGKPFAGHGAKNPAKKAFEEIMRGIVLAAGQVRNTATLPLGPDKPSVPNHSSTAQ
jgi:Mrp family chromosome partitioning ATPase